MIELITGTPGAGKSTYAVSQRLASEVGKQVNLDDETALKLGMQPGAIVQRRLVCAGVRGLKLDHDRLPHILTGDAVQPVEVAKWNAMEKSTDDAGKPVDSDIPVHKRLAGEPPQDVLACLQNWWLWCKPGDLIVCDEAQFVMPRGSLGRKPPFWLQAMEIHRHYGVDFLIITQHPQLIDTTVRALVGLHRHVRSVMGSPVCTVYVWDHASNPERYNLATKSVWMRRASHYKLFHSSVAHVKPPTSGRSILVIVPVMMLIVGALLWSFTRRWAEPAKPSKPTASLSSLTTPHDAVQPPQAFERSLAVSTPKKHREPYAGMGVHLSGSFGDASGQTRSWFRLSIDGRSVATVSDLDVRRAGYGWRTTGAPCSGVLIFGDLERPVTCDDPGDQTRQNQPPQAAQQPQHAPSAPVA